MKTKYTLLIGVSALFFAGCSQNYGLSVINTKPSPSPAASSTTNSGGPKATSTDHSSATPSPQPSATATPNPTATASPSATATPGSTATPAPSATASPVPTATATPAPSATATPAPSATASPTATATPNIVCDPLSTGTDTTSLGQKNGVKGRLFYYDDADVTAHPYSQVSDFFIWGHEQNADIYLSSLNVPTRPFDAGFMTSDGTLLKKSNGDTLFENFALKLTGGIQLPALSASKKVQFAILSDDGAVLRMGMKNSTDSGTVVVNDDKNHPTQMGCATATVDVSADARIPFELDYYQGPRYHIALILLWREVTPGMSLSEKWCGQNGNALYFDSTKTPSAPQSAYSDLMTRWSVVPGNVLFVDGYGNTSTASGSNTDNPCLKK